jgi:hypothetical protein
MFGVLVALVLAVVFAEIATGGKTRDQLDVLMGALRYRARRGRAPGRRP